MKDDPTDIKTTFDFLFHKVSNINSQNQLGETALYVACKRGIVYLAKKILTARGVDINKPDKKGNTPLHAACVSGTSEIVALLIERLVII